MRKGRVLFLSMAMLFALSACTVATSSAPQETSIEFANQQQFLQDMAKGIENRLSKVDDNAHANDTTEEYAAYYKSLVRCELDQVEQYENVTFSDSVFNRLAHDYINACKMQETGATLYKNEMLFEELWESGRSARSAIITEFYTRYDLPLTGKSAASYSLSNSGSDVSSSFPNQSSTEAGNVIELNDVIYNDNGIVITILSVEKEASNQYLIRTEFQNNTAQELTGGHIIASSTYIDDRNIRIWWEGPFDIPAGKKVIFKHSIYPTDFKEAGINSNFNKLEFTISVSDKNHKTVAEVKGTIDGKHFK